MDLNVFKDQTTASCDNGDFKHCISISRLCLTIRYYQSLKIFKKEPRQESDIFTAFMVHIYQHQVLDDYHHLIKNHADDIQDIYKYFINEKGVKKCNGINCEFATRHHRILQQQQQQSQQKRALSAKTMFYREIIDSLHVYLFHLYQYGLRSDVTKPQKQQNVDAEDEKDQYFDSQFMKMKKYINNTQSMTKSFSRYNPNSYRFTMTDNQQKGVGTLLHISSMFICYIDCVYEYIFAALFCIFSIQCHIQCGTQV